MLHLFRRDAQHAVPCPTQHAIAARVVAGSLDVGAAIHFHDQTRAAGVEVTDVALEHHLPPEDNAQLPAAKLLPQQPFRVRAFVPHLTCTDTVQTFEQLTAPQQEQLAHDAWHVGLRALMNAYRQAEEARLQDIGRSLTEDLNEQLRQHAETQEKAIAAALGRYFDPESGELGSRLRQFLGDEGTLTHLPQQHLGPRNSVLVETLTKHIGEGSPLFRRLSPTDSEGLVSTLDERLRAVLQQEHGEFQKALDPLREDAAVGRFIAMLREELARAEDDQARQLKIALAALDTTQEDSLLNQLRRETQQARAELLHAINPAREGSPLSVIKTSLTDLLAEHAKSTKAQLEEAQKQSADFQRDVRDAVQRIETRRREEQRSARGVGRVRGRRRRVHSSVLGRGWVSGGGDGQRRGSRSALQGRRRRDRVPQRTRVRGLSRRDRGQAGQELHRVEGAEGT